MPRHTSDASSRKVRFVVDCETTDQVLELLNITKLLGLHAQIGAAVQNGEEHLADRRPAVTGRRVDREDRRSGGYAEGRFANSRPKRYKAHIRVRLNSDESTLERVRPRARDVFKVLRAEYGNDVFVKGRAKAMLLEKLNIGGVTGYLTNLLDAGAIMVVDANAPPIAPRAFATRLNDMKPGKSKRGLLGKGKHGNPRKLLVRVNEAAAPDPQARPALAALFEALKAEYGTKPFEKGAAKKPMTVKMNGSTSVTKHMTNLMRTGALIRA